MKTDTPRTISAMSLKKNEELSEKDCLVFENYVHAEVCAEIERELAISLENQCKAQAEVAKLREAYLKSVERDDFLTQEVERLREQLESTKLLALKFWKVLEENGFKIELPK